MRRFLLLVACSLAYSAAGASEEAAMWQGLVASAPVPAPEGSAVCPPPGFGAVEDLDVAAYISKPWYVLAQVPLVYQPANQFYCTSAVYLPVNESDPLEGLKVVNTARQGSTTGPSTSTGGQPGATLLALVPDRSQPSQLTVGFDFPGASTLVGTQGGRGPYWVIATGGNATEGYEWAIVSAGAPTRPGGEGCRGAVPNISGLWLFSRTPENPDAYSEMMALLQDMGVDTSELVPVQQEGCTYE